MKIVVSFRSFAAIATSAITRGHDVDLAVKSCKRYMNVPRMLEQMGRASIDAAVDTESFVRNPAVRTKQLCELVDLPYFDGKENYWNYPSAHLFGSRTRSNHMLHPETGGYSPRPPITRESLPQDLHDKLQDQGMFEMEDNLRAGKFGPVVG